MSNKCKICGKEIVCAMCEAKKRGVFVPDHICPNAHEDCELVESREDVDLQKKVLELEEKFKYLNEKFENHHDMLIDITEWLEELEDKVSKLENNK
jgi:hypothetical protein